VTVAATAWPPELERRIAQTVAVRDTDALPRVDEAGDVIERDGRRLQVMHNGLVVVADSYYGDWMTEIIRRLGGHHEPQEEVVFAAVLRRLAASEVIAPAMVELGAFWGYYAMWFLRELADAGARALLVEPDPGNLDLGRLHLQLNGLQATTLRASVGTEHGRRSAFRCERDGRVRLTREVTLPGILDEQELARVDLLLCDTQGAETELLQGGAEALAAGRVRFLMISTHHHSISGDALTHQRCLHAVRAAGGHVFAEHTVSESCSGDGLIAASFAPEDADLEVPVTRVRARDSLFGEPELELAAALGEPVPDELRALSGR
jgi:FkbM family methyltransferase